MIVMEVDLPSFIARSRSASNNELSTICNEQIGHALGNRMSSFVVRHVEPDVELVETLSNFMGFKRSMKSISSDRWTTVRRS